MFERNISKILVEWKNRRGRKPLVIRGARQVGKTSAVHQFGRKAFDTYIYINLELEDNAVLFNRMLPVKERLQLIQLKFNTKISPGSTLIFLDEVQNSGIAMNQLRYFYEEMPELHVIAAGSLLEVKMKSEGFAFPVGRVEYCYLHPVTFDEFLAALGETEALKYINSVKADSVISEEIHTMMMKKFHEYLLVGGMPGVPPAEIVMPDVSPKERKVLLLSFINANIDPQLLEQVINRLSEGISKRTAIRLYGGSSLKKVLPETEIQNAKECGLDLACLSAITRRVPGASYLIVGSIGRVGDVYSFGFRVAGSGDGQLRGHVDRNMDAEPQSMLDEMERIGEKLATDMP